MIANVTFYTKEEGGLWFPWPYAPKMKPTNPQLLTHRSTHFATLYLGRGCDGAKVYQTVHSITLDDGRVWDSINGFRDGRWGEVGHPLDESAA